MKSYREHNVPQLFHIMKLSQPQSQPTMQYWNHLFTSIQVKRPIHPKFNQGSSLRCQYVFYKAKSPEIGMLYFQQSCLIAKKTLQIQYSNVKQVTCIRIFQKQNMAITKTESSNPQLMLSMGYYDGKIQIYELKNKALYDELGKSGHSIDRLCFLSTSHQQPVTGIQLYYPQHDQMSSFWIFSCKDSAVSLYKKPLGNAIQSILKMKKAQLGIGKLSIFLTKDNSLKLLMSQIVQQSSSPKYDSDQKLYIYNQLSGVACYSLPDLNQLYTISDSTVSISSTRIKCQRFAQSKSQLIRKLMIQAGIKDGPGNNHVSSINQYKNKRNSIIQEKKAGLSKELLNDVIIAGASDDSLKFIYYQQNKVIRYQGFKNFPFTIYNTQLPFDQDQDSVVWVGCLDGSVYYFKTEFGEQMGTQHKDDDLNSQQRNSRGSANKSLRKISNKEKDYFLSSQEVKCGRKIVQNGIRYLQVLGDMLLVLDVQGNIDIFDIII